MKFLDEAKIYVQSGHGGVGMEALQTPRLILRDLLPEDADAFSSYNQSADFCRYRNLSPSPEIMREKVLSHIARSTETKRDDYILAVVFKEEALVVGDVRLRLQTDMRKDFTGIATLGYGLNPHYWGQGLMTEAVGAITLYGHDSLKMHRIEAETVPENTGSWKVLESCGYQREGVRRYSTNVQGKWWPELYEYASVRADLLRATS